MTRQQEIQNFVDTANEMESRAIASMNDETYAWYMSLTRDERFHMVCAGLAASSKTLNT